MHHGDPGLAGPWTQAPHPTTSGSSGPQDSSDQPGLQLLSQDSRDDAQGVYWACTVCCTHFDALPGGELFQGFFFWPAKIGGGGIWYCSLEMKEKFGIRALVVAS